MKNGDEEGGKGGLSGKWEGEWRYKRGEEGVKSGKGMMGGGEKGLERVNVIEFMIRKI